MTALKIEQFGGMLPAWDPRLLPPDQADLSINAYLYSGALNGWRQPKLLHTLLNGAATFAFRVPTVTSSIAKAILAFVSNPQAGDTVTIGELTYTFRATPSKPFEVLLGANSTQSANNLFAALGLTGSPGITYGNGTVLNGAVTPFAPQIGLPNSIVGSTFTIPGANTMILQPVTPGATCLITDVKVMPAASNAGAHFIGVLYSDNDGVPGSLIASTPTVTGAVSGTPITGAFAVAPTVLANSQYWIGFIADTSIAIQNADSLTFGRTTTTPFSLGAPSICPPLASGGSSTLGNPNAGVGTDTPGANELFLIPVTPTVTTQLSDVRMMPGGTNAGAHFMGVVYSDDAGVPGNILSTGGQITGVTSGVTAVSQFAVPVTLQTGQQYWIGFIGDTAVAINKADTGTVGTKAANTYTNGPPPFAPTMATAQPDWQVWSTTATGTADWQLWADAAVLSSSVQTTNTIGQNNFGAGFIPVVTVFAPTYGAAYNTTGVSSSSGGRMVWVSDLVALNHTTTTMFGGTNQSVATGITASSTWLEFVDPDTNVIRSPVVNDSFGRYYYFSPSQPPQYNTLDRIQNGQPPWLLGVPAPGCAPGVLPTAGGNQLQLGFANANTGNANAPGANTIFLIPVTPNGAMIVNDISCMPTATSAGANFLGCIYEDSNGIPGTLLATATQVTGTTANVKLVSTFASPVTLNEGTQYWIGFTTDTSVALAEGDTSLTGWLAANTFSNGAPLTAPFGTTGKNDWQIWADVTSSSILETRAYVYTWVTEYGEEGPPSPPTTETSWTNATWTLTLFTPPVSDMGTSRNIVQTNIYRAITGTGGTATYFLVAQVPVTTAAFADSIADNVVALNNQLPSTNWFGPPEGLQGAAMLPNGIMVGFQGNNLLFSEPYRPHAWPVLYGQTTEFPIVGLGIVGQSVVAPTQGDPYIASGVSPSAMTITKIKIPEPCVSRGSVISTNSGVFYYSLNGLILVDGNGQASNVTEQWITREKWAKFTPQKNIRAIKLASSYFAFGTVSGADHSVAQQGFIVELASSDAQSFTIWPQAGGHRIGLNKATAPNGVDILNVEVDPWTGIGMLVQNGGVYYYDFTDQAPTIVPYKWRSKIFQNKSKHNFSAVRVWFDIPPGSPAQIARNTNDPQPTLGANQYAILRVYAGNADQFANSFNDPPLPLFCTREVYTNGELMRIYSGLKAEFWQFEVEGRVSVSNIQIGTSVADLRTV